MTLPRPPSPGSGERRHSACVPQNSSQIYACACVTTSPHSFVVPSSASYHGAAIICRLCTPGAGYLSMFNSSRHVRSTPVASHYVECQLRSAMVDCSNHRFASFRSSQQSRISSVQYEILSVAAQPDRSALLNGIASFVVVFWSRL